jgi:2-iminoacetate synthase
MIEKFLNWADDFLKEYRQKEFNFNIRRILRKEEINEEELLFLLYDQDDNNLILMAERSKKLTERYFGKVINLFTPLYLSNYCLSGCKYCGFSVENKIKRVKLNEEEIIEEYKAIKSQGIDSILLLTGCDRINTPFEYILWAVKEARKYFSEIVIEVYPMEKDEYRILVSNGLTGVTQYQETYNQKLYEELHPYGPKKDFWYRIKTQERAIEGGVFEVTLGILLGLNDPIEDTFKMLIHAKYLMKKYPKVEINISFPRFRPAGTNFSEKVKVNSKTLLRLIFSSRIYLPPLGITISTRESPEFRDNIIGYGVTKMSAGSKTSVGGYFRERDSGIQFEVEDRRSVKEFVEVIKSKGFRPEFTNWIKGEIA